MNIRACRVPEDVSAPLVKGECRICSVDWTWTVPGESDRRSWASATRVTGSVWRPMDCDSQRLCSGKLTASWKSHTRFHFNAFYRIQVVFLSYETCCNCSAIKHQACETCKRSDSCWMRSTKAQFIFKKQRHVLSIKYIKYKVYYIINMCKILFGKYIFSITLHHCILFYSL